jgi:hypothetical protein
MEEMVVLDAVLGIVVVQVAAVQDVVVVQAAVVAAVTKESE